jgi:alpha-1,2-mannosyltransferase
MPALADGLDRLRRAGTGVRPVRRSVVVTLACVAAVIAVAMFARRYGFTDLALHRDALRNWFSGDGLYAYRAAGTQLGFPLPPAAALALAPLAVLPLAVAGWLMAAASIVALVLALIVLVGPVARRYVRRRWLAVAVAAALALATEPVRTTLGLGHLDLLVFGLVTADVAGLRRRARERRRATWWPGRVRSTAQPTVGSVPGRPRGALRRGWESGSWAGVGIGLATAIATGPLVFIGYLAVTRQWRPALTAAVTALATGVLAFLVAPKEAFSWVTGVLWRIDRTGPTDATGNQSLAGVLARLYDSATTPVLLWLSFSLLVLAVGLIRARSAHAEGDEVAAFTLVGLTGLVIGPVTGTHALVWVLPAVLIAVDSAARRRTASRLPAHRGLVAARRGLGSPDRLRLGNLRRVLGTGGGHAIAGVLVYLMLVVAPIWAYEHRLPETSHHADGLVGMLMESSIGVMLILLVAALPWRPGASPAFHAHPWAPTVRRRPIPPARRPSS